MNDPSTRYLIGPGFQLEVFETYEGMSRKAMEIVSGLVRSKPDSLLCLPTGNTPTRTYELLAIDRNEDPALYDRVRILKLDEWAGLSANDEGSCESYLQKHVLVPLGVDEGRYFGFDGNAPDLEAECRRVTGLLDKIGPIDLCLLGIGVNGHLGLNEPAEVLSDTAHVVELSETSRGHAMIASVKDRPRRGLTLGMGDILRARKIVLLISGKEKRIILRRLLETGVTTMLPASFLRLHPDVTALCDRSASGPHVRGNDVGTM